MSRQSRRRGHGKRRMRGGGWLDTIQTHANNAVAQAQDLANYPKAQAAQQAAIDGANKAQGMIASAHSTISDSGQAAYNVAKPHLDTAQMHAQAAATHASNANFDDFKQSMGSMTGSLAQAHSKSQEAILAQKTSESMTVGDHVSSLGSKTTSAVSDLSKSAMGFISTLGSKPDAVPLSMPGAAQAAGRRTRKHRRHPKKGHKSRTMKGNKYYNRRVHRHSKNAMGVKRRPYRTRKGNTKKIHK